VYLVVDTLGYTHEGLRIWADDDQRLVAVVGSDVELVLDVSSSGSAARDSLTLAVDPSSDLAPWFDVDTWKLRWSPSQDDVGSHLLSVELLDEDGGTLDSLTIEIEVALLEEVSEPLIEFGFILPRPPGSPGDDQD
jgi:hypothetical protein